MPRLTLDLSRTPKYLTASELDELASIINTIIHSDVTLGRGGLIRANARVSAVMADQNPLLDVARQSYKENLEDIFALAQQYSSTLTLLLFWVIVLMSHSWLR